MARQDEEEWINWDQAMRLLRAAELGSRPWSTMAEWCGDNLIETRAASIVAGGTVSQDAVIDPAVWQNCRSDGGAAHVDAFNGSIRVRLELDDGEILSAQMAGTQFRKDQLLRLIPHVSQANIDEALAATGPWLEGAKKAVSTVESPKTPSAAGKKPDKARWHLFWFCVLDLMREDRLNAECFASASALQEEIQLLMGDAAFEQSSIKGLCSQIWKKYCAD